MSLRVLLIPTAPAEEHRLRPDSDCDDVHFSSTGHHHRGDVQGPVFQHELEGRPQARSQSIQAHIRAGRGGYQVGHPQGRCCLGHVRQAPGETQGAP